MQDRRLRSLVRESGCWSTSSPVSNSQSPNQLQSPIVSDITPLVSSLSDLLTSPDLEARRADLQSTVNKLGDVLERHDALIRNLIARVDQLELGLVYMDRGCGA